MSLNVPTSDAHKALKWMAWTAINAEEIKRESGAGVNGRACSKPVFTFRLAWHPEEGPRKWEMIGAGRRALIAFGLDEHETVMVAHSDRNHPHLHLIVNVVHPETGKASNLSYSRIKLSHWAESYEREDDGFLPVAIPLVAVERNSLRVLVRLSLGLFAALLLRLSVFRSGGLLGLTGGLGAVGPLIELRDAGLEIDFRLAVFDFLKRQLRGDIAHLENVLGNSGLLRLWWSLTRQVSRNPQESLQNMRRTLENIEWRKDEARQALQHDAEQRRRAVEERHQRERQELHPRITQQAGYSQPGTGPPSQDSDMDEDLGPSFEC